MDVRDYNAEREEKSRKLIIDFGNLVNGSADMKAIIDQFSREHRTLQQSMFKVVIGLIIYMASDEFRTDGRNEASKEMAKAFIEGYASSAKEKEIEYYKRNGYTAAEAEGKGEVYRKQIIAEPEKYIGLPLI